MPGRALSPLDHFGTVSDRSMLPPLYVPVRSSPVVREDSRDLWRSIDSSTMVVFKLLTLLSAHLLRPKKYCTISLSCSWQNNRYILDISD